MTRKSNPKPFKSKSPAKRIQWVIPAIVVAAILVGAGLLIWRQTGPQSERNDPNLVVNLTSMVGKQAPAFTLANSEGQAYTITPGDGRKYIFIFHMGSI